jgi:hypothetical protein
VGGAPGQLTALQLRVHTDERVCISCQGTGTVWG